MKYKIGSSSHHVKLTPIGKHVSDSSNFINDVSFKFINVLVLICYPFYSNIAFTGTFKPDALLIINGF